MWIILINFLSKMKNKTNPQPTFKSGPSTQCLERWNY